MTFDGGGQRGDRGGGDGVGGLSFDELVDRHWEAVYRLVYHLAGNVHDAQDLAQETFVRAIGRRASFRSGTNLRAWLMRIASNAFLDARRRRKTARAQSIEVEPAVSEPDRAESDELMTMLQGEIHNLDQTQRTVFVLRVHEEMSFREIGEILSTSEETARWHMMQARRTLMKRLEGRL